MAYTGVSSTMGATGFCNRVVMMGGVTGLLGFAWIETDEVQGQVIDPLMTKRLYSHSLQDQAPVVCVSLKGIC